MTMLSYQGISDRVVDQFIDKHGQIDWQAAQDIASQAPCPKLTSYWHFEGCNYQKVTATCARPDLISCCRLPRYALRNGRLNQTAASLYLFIRDIADGDLIGWLDGLLHEYADQPAHGRCAALIEPMRNIYGVSHKVLRCAVGHAAGRRQPASALVRNRREPSSWSTRSFTITCIALAF